ncbi:hypothetical protein C463_16836 [Halorubrum californiense DSM 19288]|uniref:Uncharacterized protein n=1 Tax=Halorubrum californiense DSM 19288 TaxID=1227465 RepID=M0DVZ9_9EURY|nr:hypothetical protein C463_16836 [Halorubrum californiense DSM 19288]
MALKALPYIVGFAGGFLSALAEADDADHAAGASSQKESSVSAGAGSNATESRQARSERTGSDSRKGPYETNEYGELVEEK